jgi:hypothetical protein
MQHLPNNIMTVQKEILEKIESFLPRGYSRLVNERVTKPFSRPYIHQVKKGQLYNQEILEALIEIAKENKAARDRMIEQANNL